MNAVRIYRRNVKWALHCFPCRKRELLARLDRQLKQFAEDNPEQITLQGLETAFGSPEYMAASLLESVPQREKLRYYGASLALRYLAAVCAVVLLCFSVYTFYIKETEVVTVYEENVFLDIGNDGRNALSEKALASLTFYEEEHPDNYIPYIWEIADDGTIFFIFSDMEGQTGLQMCRSEQIDKPHYIMESNESFSSTPVWNENKGVYNFLMSNPRGTEIYHFQVGLRTTNIDSAEGKYNVFYSIEKP